ncbi:MAG TPA: glycoside hydrolase family 3 protein, partial [Stenomitos sp.]
MDHLPPVESLTLHEAIGQLICPTLFGGDRQGIPYDAAAIGLDLARYGWGGYILFHGTRDEVASRLSALRAIARIPLLVAADLEHGAGQQVSGLHVFPTAMAFGAASEPEHAYELGAWTAREAQSVGINWVLAPVADVTNNPLNPIINIRSFGGDPLRVAAMVEAFVLGCQSQGALACAKHFPGHGDTETDSHSRLGQIRADRNRLEAVEWPPFQAAIAAGAASLMTAHLAVPALEAPDRPATLSRRIMTGVLRAEMGFDGLIVTDALVMGGITRTVDPAEAAIQAIAAGCDMLLMPPNPVVTFEALYDAAQSGRLSKERVFEAAGRVLAAKAKVHPPGTEPLGLDPETLARHVAARAITLAKGDPAWRLPEGAIGVAVDDGV